MAPNDAHPLPVNNTVNTVNIKSLNTQGLKSNTTHVSQLTENTDILFISEHWLSNAEKIILQNINKNGLHHIIFSGAEKQESGRPFGGNCFFVRKSVAEKVNVVHQDKNILAIQLKSSTVNLVIVGVYLTCYRDRSSKEDFSDQLNTITSIMEMYADESEIILMVSVPMFWTDGVGVSPAFLNQDTDHVVMPYIL